MASLLSRLRETNRGLAEAQGPQLSLDEATADTELMLRVEDIGWTRLNAQGGKESNDLKAPEREAIVRRARLYFLQDPMCSRAVKIFTSYCVGNGFSYKAKDAAAQALADAFRNHPRNRNVFGVLGQQKSSNKLNVDGEIFFALFPPGRDDVGVADGVTHVRRLPDCLEIRNIVTNPDDYEEVWYYHRVWTPTGGRTQQALYPDYRLRQIFPNGDLPVLSESVLRPYGIPSSTPIVRDTYIYHLPVNSLGERGISLLATAMGWAKAHREYLEDRVSINRALARFSWIRKIRGAASSVAKFAMNQPQSGTTDRLPYNQPAGGTMTTNQAVDWQPVNAQGGGGSAYMESRTIKLMVCAALGMPEHYLADGSNGNRATATVMERPVQLMFQDYQNALKDAYEAMLSFEIMEQGYEYDADAVDVTSPSILENDSVALATAIVQLVQAMPEVKVDATYRKALESLNIEDIQDILPEIEKRAALMFSRTGTYATNGPSLMGAGRSLNGASNGNASPSGTAAHNGASSPHN